MLFVDTDAQLREMKKTLARLRDMPPSLVSDVCLGSEGDICTWELSNFSKWQAAQTAGRVWLIHSPYFFLNSYKMRVLLNLSPPEEPDNLGLMLLIEPSPGDDSLTWPCPVSVLIEILDQRDTSQQSSVKHIVKANQFRQFKEKPTAEKPHVAIRDRMLKGGLIVGEDSPYVKKDTMYIRLSKYRS